MAAYTSQQSMMPSRSSQKWTWASFHWGYLCHFCLCTPDQEVTAVTSLSLKLLPCNCLLQLPPHHHSEKIGGGEGGSSDGVKGSCLLKVVLTSSYAPKALIEPFALLRSCMEISTRFKSNVCLLQNWRRGSFSSPLSLKQILRHRQTALH